MRRAVLTAGLLLVATACSPSGETSAPIASPSPPTSPPATSPTTSPTTTPSPQATGPTPTPAARPQPITVAVAGDVHFEGPLRTRLETDPATALAPATSTLARADLAIVNLETSIGAGGTPEPGKRYVFWAPPSAFDALAAAGIDVATMANNHALDFGREPLAATFRAIDRASLDVVGLGRDAEEAFAPSLVEVDGTTVATVGATVAGADPTADPTGQWAATDDRAGTADALDPTRLLATVREADRSADVVVAYLHWGVQGERCPSELQRTLARRLAAAGADVIVGSHTHGLQGDGRLGGAYVAYGLGNYAWYTASTTGVLTLTVQPPTSRERRARVTDAAWEPAVIGTDGLPAPLPATASAGFESDRSSLRSCAGLR